MFGFKKKDPICGMKEEKGKGMTKHNQWFCSDDCLKKYEEGVHKTEEKHNKGNCCH